MVIYSKVKLGVSPDMNALASLIIVLVGGGVGVRRVVDEPRGTATDARSQLSEQG
ncbi:MAG: hypothetical protein WDN04_07670 [Rhodospirillales bacterium]